MSQIVIASDLGSGRVVFLANQLRDLAHLRGSCARIVHSEPLVECSVNQVFQ